MTEQFTIESAEGLPIRGTLDIPENPRALVLVVHGFKGFRQWGFFPWICEELAARGIAACRFDMSRNGIGEESDDQFGRLDLFRDDTYSIEIDDLTAVARHLTERPALHKLPLFLLGHSRGGAVALLAASKVPHLCGIVTWSAISTVDRWDAATIRQWRRDGFLSVINQRTGQDMRMSTAVLDDWERNRAALDVLGAVRALSVPLLILHGAKDESVPVEEARRIAAAHPNGSLVVLAGGSHTMGAIHPMIHVPKELRLALDISARFVTMYG